MTDNKEQTTNHIPKRGDIYFANLDPVIGSEQGGHRPVLIIQNDIGNKNAPTLIVAAITTSATKAKIPTHVNFYSGDTKLKKDSLVMLEQIRTIDKQRLANYVDGVPKNIMDKINRALKISVGLP